MIEGQRYCNEYGIPAHKHLKPDAVPTSYLFKAQRQSDKPDTSGNGCSSTTPSPQSCSCSERRE